MNRSAASLAKALQAAGYAPGVVDDATGCWVRVVNLDPATGHVAVLRAHWAPDGDVAITLRRHGDMVRPISYRVLVAEVKAGVRAETAEDRVRDLLGGLYVHTERLPKAAKT